MKVFWSWQCDTPGRIGRHLVREALVEAITGVAGRGTLYEAVREEVRPAAGPSLPGPPEIGRRIFRQIRECDVFVADLTAPCTGDGSAEGDGLCNPDVAIELGYFRVVNGSAALVIVVNTAFSRRNDLSLRHLGGSPWLVTYDLPEESHLPEIGQARKALFEKIGAAFRGCGGRPARPARNRPGTDGAGISCF